MTHSETTKQIQAALVKAHAAMHNPGKTTTNTFLGNEYLPLPQLIEYVRPPLAENGLAIVQMPTSDGEYVGVSTTIIHESGEWICDSVSMIIENRKGNTLAQVAGGTITYLRRYAYAAACGIAPDSDDDGNHGVNPKAQNGNGNADIDKAHKLTAQYINESTLSDVRKKSHAQSLEDSYNNGDIAGIRAVYKKVTEAQKQTDEEPPKQKQQKEEDLF